jgi:ATP-dependent Clp protease protease subunit
MTIRKLPAITAFETRPECIQWEQPGDALSRFSPNLRAAEDEAGINVLGVIGEAFDGSGITARRVAGALRSIGERDVVVSMNSPGGDYFEGVAIYNLLREHKGKVTVKVVGLAASAASVIAMAGDEVRIAKSASIMIHNSRALVLGTRADLAKASEALAQFDESMAIVYAERTGISRAKVAVMMDAETWLTGEMAVKRGFADAFLASDEVEEDKDEKKTKAHALRLVDNALAMRGIPRSERREMLKELTGTPGAADHVTPRADGFTEALQGLKTIL